MREGLMKAVSGVQGISGVERERNGGIQERRVGWTGRIEHVFGCLVYGCFGVKRMAGRVMGE